MQKYIITASLLFFSLMLLGQEKNHPKLLTNTANWGVETFDLPTGFAREMTVTGFEEAIFHPDWTKVEKDGFWSYVFTWSITADKILDADELEKNLILYFDGLVDTQKDTIVAPKRPASALLIANSTTDDTTSFIGKVKLYDRFSTKKMLSLNVTVEQIFCKKEQKALLIFRFSPKNLDHKIWTDLMHLF